MPAVARRRTTSDYIADEALLDDADVYVDDDEDVIPTRSSAIQSGWDAALKSATEKSGGYTNDFKFKSEKQLVKFLDSEPLAVYAQHWIERPGKKSWTCLGDDCPLCEGGDVPKKKIAFSVVNFGEEDLLDETEPVVEILTVSPKTMQILRRYHQDKVTGPLDRMYYSMSREGTGPKAVFQIIAVKPRDLEEDWGLDPNEAERVVAGFEPLDPSVISFTPRAQLEEIKREVNLRSPRD